MGIGLGVVVGIGIGLRIATALHKSQVNARRGVAQQRQVVGRALGGPQHHLDAVLLQQIGIPFAKLGIRALVHPGGQHHPARRRGLQHPVGGHQQGGGQQHKRAGGERQIAQREQ